jgi:hypothetical protein
LQRRSASARRHAWARRVAQSIQGRGNNLVLKGFREFLYQFDDISFSRTPVLPLPVARYGKARDTHPSLHRNRLPPPEYGRRLRRPGTDMTSEGDFSTYSATAGSIGQLPSSWWTYRRAAAGSLLTKKSPIALKTYKTMNMRGSHTSSHENPNVSFASRGR